jgi:DNA invertase Pin-like site-specific DNA recombinase
MDIGYIRVSSVGQNTLRQLEGVDLDKTFSETVSAKGTADRVKLAECLDFCRDGDVLHVHSIDRLARNLVDLQRLVTQLTGKGVTVRFHKEALTFSGSQADPMSTLLLQMLGAVAQFEVAIINERRKEGMDAAKRAGKQIGRARSLTAEQVQEIRSKVAQGIPKTELAREYRVSRQTLYSAMEQA